MTMTVVRNAGRRWQWLRDSLALACCMWAIAAVCAVLIRASGEQWPLHATRLPVPWVPLGIAVGVLYSRGANRWPGVLFGSLCAGLTVGGIPPLAALVQASSTTLFALGIRALLRAWRVNCALERWQDPLLLSCWGIAAFLPLPWVAILPLCLVGLILVIWAAMRLGAAVASFIPFALALIESAAFIPARGPLQARPEDALMTIWTSILVISVLGMLITSLLAERDAAFRRQAISETRYRVLFEASPRPQWVYDPATLRIVMVNEAALRLYGYTREEFTELGIQALEAKQVSGAAGPLAAELDTGERRHRTRDGTTIEVDLHAKPIEFDGRSARLVFSDDLTDRNRLRGALLDASDRAGRRLGRELHDGLGQDLVALSLIARAETVRLNKGGSIDPQTLAFIENVALRAAENCRGIARGLSAFAGTGGDLSAAIRQFSDRFGHDGPPAITVTVDGGAPLVLDEGGQDHLFRIAQEAVTNAVRHACARKIDVVLTAGEKGVSLTVRDDGIGLPAHSSRAGGLGRASMRHRASAIGANFYAANAAGGGTEVRVEYVPHAQAVDEQPAR